MSARKLIGISILFLAVFAMAGCGKNSRQSPPKQQVEDAISSILPAFLSLGSVELEPLSAGRPETVKVNFKAIVIPKEDLCQLDREVEGTPKVTLLKVVQAAGTKVAIYGYVDARRTMDLWTLDTPKIQVGLQQFGLPRGSFNAQAYVTGTKEAAAALSEQAANTEAQRRAEKAAQERRDQEQKALEERQAREEKAKQEREAREEKARQEREEKAKIALEEQRQKVAEQQRKDEEQKQKEEEALRQKIMLATVPGTRYIGTIAGGDKRQRLRLVFTEQKGFLVRAEASNPDNRACKRVFTGELIFNAKPEGDSQVAYPIKISPAENGISGWTQYDCDRIYESAYNYSIMLFQTDGGLEGHAGPFTIRLQRDSGTGPYAPQPPDVIPPKKGSSH